MNLIHIYIHSLLQKPTCVGTLGQHVHLSPTLPHLSRSICPNWLQYLLQYVQFLLKPYVIHETFSVPSYPASFLKNSGCNQLNWFHIPLMGCNLHFFFFNNSAQDGIQTDIGFTQTLLSLIWANYFHDFGSSSSVKQGSYLSRERQAQSTGRDTQ